MIIDLGLRPGAYNKLKTHCSRGHPFNKENTRLVKRKGKIKRQCRACHYEGVVRRRAEGKIG